MKKWVLKRERDKVEKKIEQFKQAYSLKSLDERSKIFQDWQKFDWEKKKRWMEEGSSE